jgi:hypothetical protein
LTAVIDRRATKLFGMSAKVFIDHPSGDAPEPPPWMETTQIEQWRAELMSGSVDSINGDVEEELGGWKSTRAVTAGGSYESRC